MSAERHIDLEAERTPAVAFSDVLSRIHTRNLEDCKFCWDVADEKFPGEVMDIINKFAGLGLTTPQIFGWCKFQERGCDEPKVLEIMALATEYAVRRYAA